MPESFNRNSDFAPMTSPLLFRGSDHLRLAGLIKAVSMDGMSLSMVSDQVCILDHYAEIFMQRIRQVAPEIVHEVYFPTSSDSLLNRFNEVLSQQSMEDAMEFKTANTPAKLWIIHDAGSIPNHEIQLLARLVQNFPGSNIRVLFLLTTISKKQKLLDSFGKKIVSWEIEAPTAPQAVALLEQATNQGRQNTIRQLFKKIDMYEPPSWPPQPKPPVKEEVTATVADIKTPVIEAPSETILPPKKNFYTWILAGVLLLGLSFSYVGFYLNNSSISKQAKPRLTPSLSEIKPIPTQPTIPQVSNQPSVDSDNKISETNKDISTLSPAKKTVLNSNQQPSDIKEPIDDSLLKLLGEKVDSRNFIVVHSVEPSMANALKWQTAHPSLKNTVIYTKVSTETKLAETFIVLSGTFKSVDLAQAFIDKFSPQTGSLAISLNQFWERMGQMVSKQAPTEVIPKRKVKKVNT